MHGRSLSSRRAPVVAALLAVLLGGVLAAPAGAEERTVTVTAEGVQPEVLTVAPGDTVRFVVEDATFAYRAQSTGGDWRFDSGPVEMLSGGYAVPSPLRAPGTYTYRVAQDPPYRGTVVVSAEAAGASPATSPGGADGPVPSEAGAAGATPVPAPSAGPSAVPSSVASAAASPLPPAATETPPRSGAATLAQPATARRLGLPAALALVLVVGTGSLLLRALLAEPVLSDARTALGPGGSPRTRW